MPVAAPIIGAVGSIGSALLGRKGGAGGKSGVAGLQAAMNQGLSAGSYGLTQAGKLGREGGTNVGAAGNYLRSLLGGGQPALEAVAPEVNTILSQYDTAKKSLSEFAPRGGGTNARLADLPFQESGAITNLLAGEKAKAGETLGNLGLGEYGVASSLLPRTTGAGSSLLNYALGQASQEGQSLGEAGTALGTILGQILGRGSSSSASSWSGFPEPAGGLDTFAQFQG